MPTGVYNHFKLRKGIFRNCLTCNKEFWVPNWRLRIGKGIYCSKKCFYDDVRNGKLNKGYFKKGHTILNEWRSRMNQKGNHRSPQSEFKSGKNNLNFNNYSSFKPYNYKFNKTLKLQIRTRDNFKCQLCDRTEKEELKVWKRNLSIHHCDYDKQNCDTANLITLCHKCNTKVNKHRLFWTQYFKKIILSLEFRLHNNS